MLPTYPLIVSFRKSANSERIQGIAHALSPFNQVDRHCQHEGRGQVIERHDETESEVELATVMAELVTPMDLPLTDFTPLRLDEMLIDIAQQMARGTAEHGFAEIGKATAAVGNVVDGAGRPVSEDLLIDAFSRMEHSFDPDGSWRVPDIVGGDPAALRAIMERASFQKRLKALLARKRDDFRDREADRVLAG